MSENVVRDETTDAYGRPLSPDPEHERVETTPAALHVVLMQPNRYRVHAQQGGYGVCWHDRGDWETGHVVLLNGARYGIGYCDDTSIWNQGPGLPRKGGRQAYLFGLASVIDNHGGTGAEMRALRAQGLVSEAQAGDVLALVCMDGTESGETTLWRIECRARGRSWGDPKLELIQR
jgi:hypothetical protein